MLLYWSLHFLPGVVNTCTFMVQTFLGSNELPRVPLAREQTWQTLVTQLPVHLVLSPTPRESGLRETAPAS